MSSASFAWLYRPQCILHRLLHYSSASQLSRVEVSYVALLIQFIIVRIPALFHHLTKELPENRFLVSKITVTQRISNFFCLGLDKFKVQVYIVNELNNLFIRIDGKEVVMEDKKKLIKAAAHDVFLQKGYKSTNIADITKKAGVAVGSFYKYYGSKEEIFLEIYIDENELMRGTMVQSIDWNGNPETIIEKVFSYTFDNVMNNKILREWYGSSVSKTLSEYYNSRQGSENSAFHQFLIQTLTERMTQIGYSRKTVGSILKAMNLLSYIDSQISEDQLNDYQEGLKTLSRYFIKGILK
jgi:AcrR family transcriptional regulator